MGGSLVGREGGRIVGWMCNEGMKTKSESEVEEYGRGICGWRCNGEGTGGHLDGNIKGGGGEDMRVARLHPAFLSPIPRMHVPHPTRMHVPTSALLSVAT